LEVPQDKTRLTRYGFGGERRWFDNENMLDAWVISKGEEFNS
jgi:hypothetical protein